MNRFTQALLPRGFLVRDWMHRCEERLLLTPEHLGCINRANCTAGIGRSIIWSHFGDKKAPYVDVYSFVH